MSLAVPAASALRDAARCPVILPGDAEYERARVPFNVTVEQRPAAVAYPAHASDVAALVRAARALGLRVAVQGGAHNAGPQGALEDALLLRTNAMDAVEVDPVRRRARVEAGVRWEAVIDAAAPHGLAALHGSSPTVGVVGYSLGGGLGWLARAHGLQTSRILAVELVTAEGELVRTDADRDPELLWALRGGGGNFGIVCAMEFELVELERVYAGMMMWDIAHAERVLQAWAPWSHTAPDAATTSARLLQMPPLPEIPEPLRGRQLVMIDGAVLGPEAEAAEILAPLRALEPELDTFATVPTATLARLHGDPEEPMPYAGGTAMLGGLSREAVSAFVAAAGPGSGSSLVVAELRQLGGAAGRPDPEHGAMTGFEGSHAMFAVGIAADPASAAATAADLERMKRAMAPWTAGAPYLNFVEEATDVSAAYDPAVFARLEAVRRRMDPTGLFRANHEL